MHKQCRYFLLILLIVTTTITEATLTVNRAIKPDYYPPYLSTHISSNVEIGVETEGSTVIEFTSTTESTVTDKKTSDRTNDNQITKALSQKREKKTNPAKNSSRPKASSLIGGIVSAFSGNYEGLVNFAGGMFDHLMEPRYLWNVHNVYSTTQSDTIKTTNIRAFTNEQINKTKESIKKKFSSDINKGFIKFTVTVTNNGQKTVDIKNPTFVVNFVQPDGSRDHVIQTDTFSPVKSLYPIPAGGKHIFTLYIRDLNILHLMDRYRTSDGIEVFMQNAQVTFEGKDRLIEQVIDDYLQSGIRFDYYEGNRRLIRFVDLNKRTPTIKEFLNQEFGASFVTVNSNHKPFDTLDNYIQKITANSNQYAELKIDQINGEKLIDWRKWFISVVDENGTLLPFTVADTLKPGYSVMLGYYSARDILGDNYHPVVYEKTNLKIESNKLFKLDTDLQAGDVIEFTNLKLVSATTDQVTYRVDQQYNGDRGVGRLLVSHPDYQALYLLNKSTGKPNKLPLGWESWLQGRVYITHLTPVKITPTRLSLNEIIYERGVDQTTFKHINTDSPLMPIIESVMISKMLELIRPIVGDKYIEGKPNKLYRKNRIPVHAFSFQPSDPNVGFVLDNPEIFQEIIENENLPYHSITMVKSLPNKRNMWMLSIPERKYGPMRIVSLKHPSLKGQHIITKYMSFGYFSFYAMLDLNPLHISTDGKLLPPHLFLKNIPPSLTAQSNNLMNDKVKLSASAISAEHLKGLSDHFGDYVIVDDGRGKSTFEEKGLSVLLQADVRVIRMGVSL